MNALINQIRQQVGNVIANLAVTKIGLVNTVDPASFTCVVEYQPENADGTKNLSPSLPIIAVAIGNGFGMGCLPNIGDQVYIIFEEGSQQGGAVVGGIFSNIDIAPGMNAGEPFIIHQSGSYIKLTNDGKVSINGNVEIDLTAPVINITTTAAININAATANITTTGAATVTAPSISLGNGIGTPTALVTLSQLQTYLAEHIHSGVMTGGGMTGTPTTTLSSSAGTTVVSGV